MITKTLMKTLKLFSRCEQNKTVLLGATVLLSACGWMTGCATLPAEGASVDQEASSAADSDNSTAIAAETTDKVQESATLPKQSASKIALVDDTSPASSKTSTNELDESSKKEAANKAESKAAVQSAAQPVEQKAIEDTTVVAKLAESKESLKQAKMVKEEAVQTEAVQDEQAVEQKAAKTFTITVKKLSTENVQAQEQQAETAPQAVQPTDTPVAKTEAVVAQSAAVEKAEVQAEPKFQPKPEAVKAKKQTAVEVPQPVVESEQAVVASQPVQAVEVSKDAADKTAKQRQVMTEPTEKPAATKAEKKAKTPAATSTVQERAPVQYQCEAQQCPRADLKEIKIDLMGEAPKLIIPTYTGLIAKSQWTRLGTVLDVEWQDAAGAKKLEKLTMDVLDTKHLTLKDEQGKINRYMIVEEVKVEPAAAARP